MCVSLRQTSSELPSVPTKWFSSFLRSWSLAAAHKTSLLFFRDFSYMASLRWYSLYFWMHFLCFLHFSFSSWPLFFLPCLIPQENTYSNWFCKENIFVSNRRLTEWEPQTVWRSFKVNCPQEGIWMTKLFTVIYSAMNCLHWWDRKRERERTVDWR